RVRIGDERRGDHRSERNARTDARVDQAGTRGRDPRSRPRHPPSVVTLDDPKGLVRSGYDRISEAYRADSFSLAGTWYRTALDALEEVVPEGFRILDLGCGCGVPIAAELSRRHRVTGVDLSARQVERARALVPGAAFVRADMTSVAFRSGSFDAIVSLFAIIHVPTGEQASVFDAIVGWLRPGGILLVTV